MKPLTLDMKSLHTLSGTRANGARKCGGGTTNCPTSMTCPSGGSVCILCEQS